MLFSRGCKFFIQLYLNVFGLLVFLPIVFILYLLLMTWRFLIYIILKLKYRQTFVCLLKATDTNIWSTEKATGRAIVNTYLHLKCKNDSNASEIVEKFRSGIKEKCSKPKLEKLFYERSLEYGYQFWQRHDQTDIKNYVNLIDTDLHSDRKSNCKLMGNKVLDKYLADVSNKALPLNYALTWEMLIGKPCPMTGRRRR